MSTRQHRQPSANLDWVEIGKIKLHGSGFCSYLSLGRCNYRVGEVCGVGDGIGISEQ